MDKPLISMIIPVYKAADVLENCVISILKQAPEDSQLILVDDGSPDSSGFLCDQLAAGDDRVLVIHQQNKGAAGARNAGLSAARGQWVQFVDADDSLLPGLYDEAIPLLQEFRPDLLVFGIRPMEGQADQFPAGHWNSPAQLPGTADLIDRLLIHGSSLAAPYGKFYKREAIGTLAFDKKLKINEDFLFNTLFLAQCGSIVFLPKPFYLYNNSAQGSLSRQLRDDLLFAEEYTRPALISLANALNLSQAEKEDLLKSRRTHSVICQFGLLAGQKGHLSLSRRIDLTRQIFADTDALKILVSQYKNDKSPLSIPYRLCFALHAPSLLAIYCAAKSRFL